MTVIICGIPTNENGLYYCHCGFTSGDLEDFATTCCWECVFSDYEDYYYDDEEDIAD